MYCTKGWLVVTGQRCQDLEAVKFIVDDERAVP